MNKYLAGILILVIIAAGALFLPILDFTSPEASFILWQLRLPRILFAIFIGSSITLAGVVYQTVFKNPLAEPYLLGVSAGAACGSALTLIFKFSFTFLIFNSVFIFSFLFGIGAVLLVYFFAIAFQQVKTEKLILFGVGISAFFSAILSLTIILSDQLRAIYFWLLGSLSGADWEKVLIIALFLTVFFVIFLFSSRKMDILKLSDEESYSLGLNVSQTRFFLIFSATILTALSVSFAGIIGFVGLIAPHIARILFGHSHLKLIPGAILSGAILLLLSDTLARTLFYPLEIPIGVITAFIGVPYFIFLLTEKKNNG